MKIKIWLANFTRCFGWSTALLAVLVLLSQLLFTDKALSVENQSQVLVAHCFDGDTVKLSDRRVVRIAGIDTPEVAHDKNPEQFYAKKARDELFNILAGHKVTIREVSANGRDRHGRIVVDLILEDGQSIAELMIRRGAAFFYPHRDLAPEFQERLLGLQREAIAERAGLWGIILEDKVAHASYVGNRDSLRFVPENCPQAQRIKPRNKVYFGTLMDAFLAGFAPARICPFWPSAEGK